jgi:hypothetical protein
MNKLGKFYLAHPFNARRYIRDWELGIEARTGVELVNPFYDAPERRDVHDIDTGRTKRYEQLVPEELVRKDLEQITLAQGTVAIVDGSLSYGTIMEIVYTRTVFCKPVILICTNGHHDHPWLRFHSNEIFTSFEEYEAWLKS